MIRGITTPLPETRPWRRFREAAGRSRTTATAWSHRATQTWSAATDQTWADADSDPQPPGPGQSARTREGWDTFDSAGISCRGHTPPLLATRLRPRPAD